MNDNFPPNLEAAKARLERAVSRLEELLAEAAKASQADALSSAGELAALRDDHASLGEAFKALEAENAELRKVTQAVSSRLDATIDDLKTILEG